MSYKIMLVDDDPDMIKMLSDYFMLVGYQIVTALDGEQAINKVKCNPDIIVLDVNMPKLSGFDVCVKIRDLVSCPIVFLTAKAEEQDRITGLQLGGDDYILKPFSLKELDARIKAHLKREQRNRQRSMVTYKEGLLIDYSAKRVFYKEEEILLTGLEFSILEFLSMNPGRVFDKEIIYENTNGYDTDSSSRVITVLISRIRKKFQYYSDHEWIETVWGIGYRWEK